MRAIALLFLAANICLADESPELSFSASIPSQGGVNLTAWNDTVAVVGLGSVAYFKSAGDGIPSLAKYTGNISTRSARLFHGRSNGNLVATESGVGGLVFNGSSLTYRAAYSGPVVLSGRMAFPTWIDGGLYERQSGTSTVGGLLNCLGGSRYLERSSNGQWLLMGTSGVYGETQDPKGGMTLASNHCDIESSTGVAAKIGWVSGTRWSVTTGDPRLETRPANGTWFDADHVDWVLSGWNGHWMAMDQTNSGAIYYNRTGSTGNVVDSFRIPGLPKVASSGAQVARADSLVVFGSDSAVVAFKWKPEGISAAVMGTVQGGGIRAVALADTNLWLLTSTDLIRIRVGWPTGSTSGAIRKSSLPRSLSIAGIDGGASLKWTGNGIAEIRLTDAAGRYAESIALRSGETRNWHAPSRGVYFASTPTGSQRLLVR